MRLVTFVLKQDNHLQIVDTSVDRGVASVPCVNLSDYGQPEEHKIILRFNPVPTGWSKLVTIDVRATQQNLN